MPFLLFAPGVGCSDSGGFPGGLQVLARVSLDLSGFGFLVIALLFLALNLYGSLAYRRARVADATGAPTTQTPEGIGQPREPGAAAA
ncbi:hypothetical protein [Actinomyces glycerinitolerans]|uniref:Uncharacterized protein n=1 Tax=Actinomyces glycerinitolerans TaxID=1892869 RepID=A0A1M4S2T9_9ACTO|nr:hypothetical protein [Actinomyces glycerinitolerans]SHE26501.1 Hypothetical protein ACGLYG10_2752 [Actinomyces glycerinitolerans]